MHWIVVNVIERGPEMSIGFHSRLDAIEPNVPATLILFAVPVESRPSMMPANFTSNTGNFLVRMRA